MAFWGVCLHRLAPPYYCLGFRYPGTCYFVPPHMLALPVLDCDICPLKGFAPVQMIWRVELYKKKKWQAREEAPGASLAISRHVSTRFLSSLVANNEKKPYKDNAGMPLFVHVLLCERAIGAPLTPHAVRSSGSPNLSQMQLWHVWLVFFFRFFPSALLSVQLQNPTCSVQEQKHKRAVNHIFFFSLHGWQQELYFFF